MSESGSSRRQVSPIAGGGEPPGPEIGTEVGGCAVVGALPDGVLGAEYEVRAPDGKAGVLRFFPQMLRSAERDVITRALQEAVAAQPIRHPNLIRLLKVGTHQGRVFLISEMFDGTPVSAVMAAEGPRSPREATRIVRAVLDALAVVHVAGLTHRDVDPDNILLGHDGAVRLSAWGLVRAVEEFQGLRRGIPLASPPFCSPELYQTGHADGRSDLYSLGATYYALLTGRPPFEADTSMQVLHKHCTEAIPDPHALDDRIPAACGAVVARAMAKNPAQRYQSHREMAADLDRLLARMPADAPAAAGPLPGAAENGGLRRPGPGESQTPLAQLDSDDEMPIIADRYRESSSARLKPLPGGAAGMAGTGSSGRRAPLTAEELPDAGPTPARKSRTYLYVTIGAGLAAAAAVGILLVKGWLDNREHHDPPAEAKAKKQEPVDPTPEPKPPDKPVAIEVPVEKTPRVVAPEADPAEQELQSLSKNAVEALKKRDWTTAMAMAQALRTFEERTHAGPPSQQSLAKKALEVLDRYSPAELFEDAGMELSKQLSKGKDEGGKGKGNITKEQGDKYSGVACVKVTPLQRFHERIPGWQFTVAENPRLGEYRYIRFAWKKNGGEAIAIQLADNGKFGTGGPQGQGKRYLAGTGPTFAACKVAETIPTEWTVVTRDLFADFGAFTLTGIALTAHDGNFALYDHIYLARTMDDFKKLPAKAK